MGCPLSRTCTRLCKALLQPILRCLVYTLSLDRNTKNTPRPCARSNDLRITKYERYMLSLLIVDKLNAQTGAQCPATEIFPSSPRSISHVNVPISIDADTKFVISHVNRSQNKDPVLRFPDIAPTRHAKLYAGRCQAFTHPRVSVRYSNGILLPVTAAAGSRRRAAVCAHQITKTATRISRYGPIHGSSCTSK